MQVLVLDNYDSFTFNLVQALAVLGAEVKVARNDEITVQQVADLAPDRIILSPGPGTPERAGISIPLVQRMAGLTPILGVCLGHQAIAAAFGGSIRRARTPTHGKTSRIFHDGAGVLVELPVPFEAARYHSLVVEETSLPSQLLPTAHDDEGELMGLRHASLEAPLEGVQFHPESFLTPMGSRIMAAFLTARPLEVIP